MEHLIKNTTLEGKILLAQIQIRQWHRYWQGNVSVSFSGGLNSTVLLHMVREIYPDVVAVFADTGLEYPEIRDFVKLHPNVVWLKPAMTFKKVIETHGYPVISKQTIFRIRVIREDRPTAQATIRFYKTGIRRDGTFNKQAKVSNKWIKLAWAPFKVSEKCCDELKVGPLKRYDKKKGTKPFIGIRSGKGGQKRSLKNRNCNLYDTKYPKSAPLIEWSDADIREYIKIYDLPYSTIYDKGYDTTGCMFCMFGIHLEKGENRFQKMAVTHPRQHKTCMDKLGIRQVLEYIGIDPNPLEKPKGFFTNEEII